MDEEKELDKAILNLNRILDESGIKSARKITILRIADSYANIKTLSIVEKVIKEEKNDWVHPKNVLMVNRVCEKILTRTKNEIGE